MDNMPVFRYNISYLSHLKKGFLLRYGRPIFYEYAWYHLELER